MDLIWIGHSLEHIFSDELIKTLRSFYEALNKNGKIFIEIPNDVKMKTFNAPHTLFLKKSLKKLFKKLNFKIIAYSEINDLDEYMDEENLPKSTNGNQKKNS